MSLPSWRWMVAWMLASVVVWVLVIAANVAFLRWVKS